MVFAGYTAAFYDAVSRAGSLETCGFKQHFWSLLGLRPKVTRARDAEYSPRWGHGGNMSGPSGTPAPTGCVYLGAPVFGKPPIWTQQSRCTITDRRVAARCVGAAAGMGVQAIRCGTFLYRGWNRTREIQKPLVFGGVLFHISFAVERNMAAGGIHAGRGCSPQSENAQRAVEDAGPYGVRLSGCAGIRETADMDATVPLHDNRPARRRAVRGSGSGERRTSDSLYDDQHIFWFSRGTRRRFMTRSAAQEVLKPAVSSSVFGHFWGCGQK